MNHVLTHWGFLRTGAVVHYSSSSSGTEAEKKAKVLCVLSRDSWQLDCQGSIQSLNLWWRVYWWTKLNRYSCGFVLIPLPNCLVHWLTQTVTKRSLTCSTLSVDWCWLHLGCKLCSFYSRCPKCQFAHLSWSHHTPRESPFPGDIYWRKSDNRVKVIGIPL